MMNVSEMWPWLIVKFSPAMLSFFLSVAQVAFSASLLTSGSGHTGPFSTFTPLVFRNVLTNIGNAYNPNTGDFITPVRGAYHFEFHVAAYGNSHYSSTVLVKNGQHVVVADENEVRGWSQSSNGATLLLEPNDVVSLRLWVNARVYENQNRHNTFSGRLLFTMWRQIPVFDDVAPWKQTGQTGLGSLQHSSLGE